MPKNLRKALLGFLLLSNFFLGFFFWSYQQPPALVAYMNANGIFWGTYPSHGLLLHLTPPTTFENPFPDFFFIPFHRPKIIDLSQKTLPFSSPYFSYLPAEGWGYLSVGKTRWMLFFTKTFKEKTLPLGFPSDIWVFATLPPKKDFETLTQYLPPPQKAIISLVRPSPTLKNFAIKHALPLITLKESVKILFLTPFFKLYLRE